MNEKLKELKNEEIVWIIYIGIIILSFYSNNLERKYFLFENDEDRERYRKIMILIFSILLIVYFYFLKSSYDDVMNLRKTDTNKKINLTNLSFIASLLIFISGFIFLYIAYSDQSLDVEIAFN